MSKHKPSLNYQELVQPYSDEDLKMTPAIEAKLNKLLQFFNETGIDYDKISKDKKKTAYPNYDEYMPTPPSYDLNKWIKAVQELYAMEKNGINRVGAIKQITSGWKITETFDFLNWLRYYQGGNHMKYKMSEKQITSPIKTAQLWYENLDKPGYLLHIKPDQPKEPEQSISGKDIDFAKDTANSNHEKRQTIEKQRSKIIGRLDSAEKLLRSTDGQTFAGKELEALMEAIYQLKKKIQLVNKVSTSTRLYADMIVREANTLQRDGFFKAAEKLYSMAEDKPNDQKLPPATSPNDPSGAGHPGAPGNLPSMGPGMPQQAPFTTAVQGDNASSPSNLKGVDGKPQPTAAVGVAPPMPKSPEKPTAPGINQFLDNMETGKITTTEDSGSSEDHLEVSDAEELLVSEAQIAPDDVPITDRPTPTKSKSIPEVVPTDKKLNAPATEEPLEVSEDDLKTTPGQAATPAQISEFDQKIDQAFADVSIQDVVTKLDGIANIFRTREIARQLSLVDFMLNSLNMSSLFPTLSECINKNLDAGQYCLTRLEDMLSSLKGAIPSQTMELTNTNTTKPEIAGIKNKLEQDQAKERARKQQRKNQENAETDLTATPAKETPQVEMAEDLAPPVNKPAVPLPAVP
jgi:hypothetical protein